jgi:hypothetical protein
MNLPSWTISRDRRLAAVEWLVAASVAAFALFIYVNGAFFSPVSAPHVDFSINFTAAHALRSGANPYGETTLFERAEELGSPTRYVYRHLFTSYIQPPTSALSIVPLTLLEWRDASRLYLVVNNLLLAASVALMLYVVRPTVPWLWAGVGAIVLVAFFSQVYGSLALGQVDPTITFLLVLGLLGYKTDRPALTGSAIALAAAIKLLPAILLLYFVWRREYRTVVWGVGVGLAILLVSIPLAGFDTYRTYLTETVPALTKGSTYYSNISLVGLITRPYVPGPLGGLDPLEALDEVPYVAEARVLSLLATLAILAVLATILGRSSETRALDAAPTSQVYVTEYFLVVAAALMISSVTWDFYVVWLLPFFVAVCLAPEKLLPLRPSLRWAFGGFLLLSYLALNYPGDYYIFDVNYVFYHPEWVPGIWVEDRVNFHRDYLELVPILRFSALALFAATLAGIVLSERLQEAAAAEAPAPEQGGGQPVLD